MARKTFAADEILSAEDVNDHLNPTTAPFIPFATAAGTTLITISGGTGSVEVSFPQDRFTVAPHLQVSRGHTGGDWYPMINPSEVSHDAAIIRTTGSGAGTVRIWWLAIQMTADNAAG